MDVMGMGMGMSKFTKPINAEDVELNHSLHVPLNLTGIVPSKVNNSFCAPSLYAAMKNRLYSVPFRKQPLEKNLRCLVKNPISITR